MFARAFFVYTLVILGSAELLDGIVVVEVVGSLTAAVVAATQYVLSHTHHRCACGWGAASVDHEWISIAGWRINARQTGLGP